MHHLQIDKEETINKKKIYNVLVVTVAVTHIAEGRGKEVARIKPMDTNNSVCASSF